MESQKKSILITGAAGFIGAAVAQKFIDEGFRVITIDNLSTGSRENIPKGVEFYEGNVFDTKIISLLVNENFFAILHIAGQSSGEISFDDPEYDLNSNTTSTLKLLQLARQTNCKNFIYASTMSIYGLQPDEAIAEDFEPNPKSFYAVGKLASEQYMRIYSSKDLNCISLRLFNVYGPGQNMNNMRQGMISIYMSQALKNGSIYVKGDKDRFRDMVFIDDVVNAFWLATFKAKSGYSCYNVCTGVKTTVETAVNSIVSLIGKNISVVYEGTTAGDIFGIYGCNIKIKTELNWQPFINFQQGLSLMYQWATKNI